MYIVIYKFNCSGAGKTVANKPALGLASGST